MSFVDFLVCMGVLVFVTALFWPSFNFDRIEDFGLHRVIESVILVEKELIIQDKNYSTFVDYYKHTSIASL